MPEISIPAPPRGASTGGGVGDIRITISIPAPPRGASASEWHNAEGTISIPAPPRGASHRHFLRAVLVYFNTSPSTRGFRECTRSSPHRTISIPAPPRGASVVTTIKRDSETFQYQPLHEGLPGSHSKRRASLKFQYQPLHEGLLSLGSSLLRQPYFNTSPSTRGFQRRRGGRSEQDISIPAPPRGASPRR